MQIRVNIIIGNKKNIELEFKNKHEFIDFFWEDSYCKGSFNNLLRKLEEINES